MAALEEHIRRESQTQKEAAEKFGVTTPHLRSHRDRIDLFSIDILVDLLSTAGLHIELHIAKAA